MSMKMTSEIKTRVVAYVQTQGKVQGCIHALPIQISQATIDNYLSPGHKYYDPEFRARVDRAKEIYREVWRAQHPHEDQELILMCDEKFRWMVEHGYTKIKRRPSKTERDPKTGKPILEIVEVLEYPGIPEWIYDRVFPRREMTIESLILMIGFSWSFVTDPDSHFSQEMQDVVLEFLSILKTEGLKQLEKHGLKIKAGVV